MAQLLSEAELWKLAREFKSPACTDLSRQLLHPAWTFSRGTSGPCSWHPAATAARGTAEHVGLPCASDPTLSSTNPTSDIKQAQSTLPRPDVPVAVASTGRSTVLGVALMERPKGRGLLLCRAYLGALGPSLLKKLQRQQCNASGR